MTLELAMASFLEDPRLFGDMRLPSTRLFWAEACNYAYDVLNMTARVRDEWDMDSAYQTFHGRVRLLPFLKPGFHHVKRTLTSEPMAEACFYLNGGNNHAQH